MKRRRTGFAALVLCMSLSLFTATLEHSASAASAVNIGDVSGNVAVIVDAPRTMASESTWGKLIGAISKGIDIIGGLLGGGSGGGNGGGGGNGSGGGGGSSNCKVTIEIKGSVGGDLNVGNVNCGGSQTGDSSSGSKQ